MKTANITSSNRIKKTYEFDKIYKTGLKYFGNYVIFNYLVLSQNDDPKLGITVSRKIGKAFERNYIKRVVREIFRKNKIFFKKKYALVVTAKKTIKNKHYDEIEKDILNIFHKIGLLA